jgi:hypothetical protein
MYDIINSCETSPLLEKLTRKDIREAGLVITDNEARFLVDYYYIMQDDRIRFNNQVRSMKDEPVTLLASLANQASSLESVVSKALDDYSMKHKMGPWIRSQYGIGPVITAGLLANLDIHRAPTAGSFWSICGINPGQRRVKGQKLDYSPTLKTLQWKIGQSFMKFSGKDKCFYGKLYLQRKARELANNEAGEYAEYAKKMLADFNYGKETSAYKCLIEGKLPPGQIDARARRWAVKIFLSHLHAEWYRTEFNKEPPLPFAIAILNHAHMIFPPDHFFDDNAKPEKASE